MKDVLNKIFCFLKYILLIVAFGLVFYGIMATYSRLDKSLAEATGVFIPFAFVLILFIVNIIVNNSANKNLLFNFVSCVVFTEAIVVSLRAMFDKNMMLFYKYGINFNSAFFADNLSAIQFMLYVIGISNILLIVGDFFEKSEKHDKKISL